MRNVVPYRNFTLSQSDLKLTLLKPSMVSVLARTKNRIEKTNNKTNGVITQAIRLVTSARDQDLGR